MPERSSRVAIRVAEETVAWPRPGMIVPQLPAAPRLDAQPADAEWTETAEASLACPLGAATPEAADTSFRIGHRDGALFILLRYAWPPEFPIRASPAAHDGPIWTDDVTELLFASPDNLARVCQLGFNHAGVTADQRVTCNPERERVLSRDPRWDPPWEAHCGRDARGRYALLHIPLRELGLGTKPGDAFRFDIVRSAEAAPVRNAHWSPIPGRMNCNPRFFGVALLGGAAGTTVRVQPAWQDHLLLVEEPQPLAAMAEGPVSFTVQCPIACREGARVALLDAQGKSRAASELASPRWPLRVTFEGPGLQPGAYLAQIEAPALGLNAQVDLCCRPWLLVSCESRDCAVEGNVRLIEYPRSVGRKALCMTAESRAVFTGRGRSVRLKRPLLFQTPGPSYGSFLGGRLRWSIDSGPLHEVSPAAAPQEIALAENLSGGEHRVTIECVAGRVLVEAIRFAAEPLSVLSGLITSDAASELLVDVRAEVFQGERLIRSECVRSPHDGRFVIAGLEPGRYRARFTAAGWMPLELPEVVIASGETCDLGVLVLRREPRCAARPWDPGPMFGRTANVPPGGEFTALLQWPDGGTVRAFLASRFVRREAIIRRVERLDYGMWNSVARVSLKVPGDLPHDLYDLRLEFGPLTVLYPQAVAVRPPLPERYLLAGCGHMNTWGQETAEYLARVAETAQLAGARMLLVANEVNAAYLSGALSGLRIPYAVASGNHTMPRWEEFFGAGSQVTDDGPLRLVTMGRAPYLSWAEPFSLIAARADAAARVLLCFEGFAPVDLIRQGGVNLLYDGHSDTPHPARAGFPPGALHFRAPGQETLRLIPMTRAGLAPEVHSAADVPVIEIPRTGLPPLRVEFSAPNDGASSEMTARVVNETRQRLAAVPLRFLMKSGACNVRGGVMTQSFDSDDRLLRIADVETSIGPEESVEVRVAAGR